MRRSNERQPTYVDYETTGSRVRQLRKEHSMSQRHLADLLEVSQNAVSDIEKGKTRLSLDQAYCLRERFKVDLDWLCPKKIGVID